MSIQQTVFPFKIERTKERLTAHGGLALMAEFNHGIGLRELTDRYLPAPGSNRGFDPSEIVDTVVLMLQGGGGRLEQAGLGLHRSRKRSFFVTKQFTLDESGH